MWLCRTIPDMRVHIPPGCGADGTRRASQGFLGHRNRKKGSRIVTVCCVVNRTGHRRKNVRVSIQGTVSSPLSLAVFHSRVFDPRTNPIPVHREVLAEPCCSVLCFSCPPSSPFGDEGDHYSIFNNFHPCEICTPHRL